MDERETDPPPPFFARWSQRKLQRRRDEAVTAPATPSHDTPPSTPPAAGDSDVSSLPAIESLDEASDYSAFLAPEVTDDLQRLALRKLFGTDRFKIRDGLDDYDEDYRFFEALGDTITAEMRHRMAHLSDTSRATDTTPQGDAPDEEVTMQTRATKDTATVSAESSASPPTDTSRSDE